MAAPEYVPVDSTAPARAYGSPQRLDEPWLADRPGDIVREGQPWGPQLGNPGPDIGYALKLARTFRDKLVLAEGEHLDDVIAGCVQVAMKRAALLGRGPVVHDLTQAFTLFGYLSEAPADLVEFRRPLFAEVAHSHHYTERRRIADLASEEALRRPVTRLAAAVSASWQRLFNLPTAA
ncbi:MAG: hypothetical protein JJE52_10215 [Acidimicrobiia bacterium]|nr:hypothetical protein [Acidimicrobiia bacterium]